MTSLPPSLTIVEVLSRAQWRAWLRANHATSTGVWAVTVKKAALTDREEYVGAVDLNEECLCFGWIDSRPGKVDERRTALLCTPRKPGSGRSKVNKDRLTSLLERGLVAPAGSAAIEAAKADGSWSRLDHIDALLVPDDLAAALDALPPAAEHFGGFPPSTRCGILEWIAAAKTGRDARQADRSDRTPRARQRTRQPMAPRMSRCRGPRRQR